MVDLTTKEKPTKKVANKVVKKVDKKPTKKATKAKWILRKYRMTEFQKKISELKKKFGEDYDMADDIVDDDFLIED